MRTRIELELKLDPKNCIRIEIGNYFKNWNIHWSGIARHVRAVLKEAHDEVVDSIRNVKEGEFTCERGVLDGVECFSKVQRDEGSIRLDGQVATGLLV